MVSVIIPTYNAEGFIALTLESVCAQSYSDFEIFVVDDCSTDDTCQIVEDLIAQDPRIHLVKLNQNSGTPGVPRNVGIAHARGAYVAFLDADDIWHVDKLKMQMDLMGATESRLISTAMCNFTDPSDVDPARPVSHLPIQKIKLINQLIKYRTPTSSLLMHKSIFEDLSFSEDPALRGREDLLFSIDFHRTHKYSLKINSQLVFYRVHPEQISASKIKMFIAVLKIIAYTDLGKYRYYKLFFPFFIISNLILSIYYRLVLKAL